MSESQVDTDKDGRSVGEKIIEIWVFGGIRFDEDVKKTTEIWLPLPANLDKTYIFPLGKDKGHAHCVPGTEYEVKIDRHADGSVSLYDNSARRVGRHEDEEMRAIIEARHKAAQTILRVQRMEAADKKESALDEALEPLLAIAKGMIPPHRDAFLAYVIRQIARVW